MPESSMTGTYPKYIIGTFTQDRMEDADTAECMLLHESPPDQEAVSIVLLEDFICLERGKVIEIQRHQFEPACTQEEL